MHSRRSKNTRSQRKPSLCCGVQLRFSDVSCVILKRLGASDAAPAASMSLSARTAAPRLAPRTSPTHPLQPRAHPPQPTAPIIISASPAFASTHSQRSWPPMHAAYHRGPATSASSSLRGSVPATLLHLLGSDWLHAPPPTRLAPGKPSPSATAPRPTASARSTQHHPMHSRRSQAPTHIAAAADACSIPPRSSDVSCVIRKRHGASDAAPASPK